MCLEKVFDGRNHDILLVSVGRDSGAQQHAGAIPGKVFDYLSCHRPILVTGPPECEVGKLVTRLGRGIAVPDDAPDRIAEAISRLLDHRGESGPLRLEQEAVAEVESRSVVKQLADFFERVSTQHAVPTEIQRADVLDRPGH